MLTHFFPFLQNYQHLSFQLLSTVFKGKSLERHGLLLNAWAKVRADSQNGSYLREERSDLRGH